MNILIIGGTRFIGLEVTRQLTEAGHTLTLYHRTPISSLPYKQMQGDLCDSNTLRLVISKVSPDCIIHMNLMEKKHIEALESALTKKTRVVIVSSVDVYKAFEV
jgi:nucleoside-diphosphate-sugar epimerase